MKKIRSTLLVFGLMLILALAAVACAQTGSDAMDVKMVNGQAEATFVVS